MIDLRNYKDYIRELVSEQDKKDTNWRWSVKSIGKSLVRIRWGYLDYLEEKENKHKFVRQLAHLSIFCCPACGFLSSVRAV